MRELRCDHTMHGVVVDGKTLEVKCRNSRCGARSGVVVLHRFNLQTGRLVNTKRFRDPGREVNRRNANHNASVAVRSA